MKNSLKTVALLLLFPTAVSAQDWSGFYGGLTFGNGTGRLGVEGTPGYDLKGQVRGAFAGYSMQSGSLVYGAELAYQSAEIFLVPSTNQGADRLIDLKGRLGYATGSAVIYGVLGYSSNRFFAKSDTSTGGGLAYGVGVDYKLTPRAFVGAEYLVRDMHNDEDSPIFELDPEVSTFSLRLGMKF
jgi:outer membrane immunogenic protein